MVKKRKEFRHYRRLTAEQLRLQMRKVKPKLKEVEPNLQVITEMVNKMKATGKPYGFVIRLSRNKRRILKSGF